MQGLLLCAIVEQSDCKSSSCFCIERCRPSILWWRGCGASFAVTSRSRPRKDGQSLYLTGVHFTEYTSQGISWACVLGCISYAMALKMATIIPRGCDVSPVFALRDKRSLSAATGAHGSRPAEVRFSRIGVFGNCSYYHLHDSNAFRIPSHSFQFVRALDIRGSKVYVGFFKGVQDASISATTNPVRPDYIILQAKTPPSRGARHASPQVIEGYQRCLPFPRLYKLSQTPENGQRDVSPSNALSLGDWRALHEQTPSRCKYVTSTSDRLSQGWRSRPVCIVFVAGMPGVDLNITDTL
jgi:hypothetical protein